MNKKASIKLWIYGIVMCLLFSALLVGAMYLHSNNRKNKMDIAKQYELNGDIETAIELYEELDPFRPALIEAKRLRHKLLVQNNECLNGDNCLCWRLSG